jgi:hypothetical protein
MYLEYFVIGKLVSDRKNLEGSCKIQYFYFVKNEDAKLFHGIWIKPEIEKNSTENRMGKGFCSFYVMVQSAAVVQPAFGRQACSGGLGFPILGYSCLR